MLGASPDAKVVDFGCSLGGQGGRVVSTSDLQSGGPGFESRSGHLLDLCSVVPKKPNKEPKEYQMTVHRFGATTSPGC